MTLVRVSAFCLLYCFHTVGWVMVRTAGLQQTCATYRKVVFWNKWRKKNAGELPNQGSPAKRPLKWRRCRMSSQQCQSTTTLIIISRFTLRSHMTNSSLLNQFPTNSLLIKFHLTHHNINSRCGHGISGEWKMSEWTEVASSYQREISAAHRPVHQQVQWRSALSPSFDVSDSHTG